MTFLIAKGVIHPFGDAMVDREAPHTESWRRLARLRDVQESFDEGCILTLYR
jgi:hypothetical protein